MEKMEGDLAIKGNIKPHWWPCS